MVRLLVYSPDFNADEHVWAWLREGVTATTGFGTAAKVREHVDPFFAGLATHTAEVRQRCSLGPMPSMRRVPSPSAFLLRNRRHECNVDSTVAVV